MKIVLASRSPRRKKALKGIIAIFRTLAADEPKKTKGRTLTARTSFLALAKCRSAARRFPHSFVIAADTLATCAGKIMGKPKSKKEAQVMVERLSGKKMEAVTSIALCRRGQKRPKVWSEKGWVKFRKLDAGEISHYVHSNLWKGKAGAINVEEKPVSGWIVKKGGEFGAVVGLPTKKLRRELEACE